MQVLSVGFEEIQGFRMGPRGVQAAFLALGQHVGIDVGDSDGGVWRVIDVVRVIEDAEGDVAGATGDVEALPACARRSAGGCGG